MTARKKSKYSTSARMNAHRTKTIGARRTFEFLGLRYQAPARVVDEVRRKLRLYKQESEDPVGVDVFIKSVQGDLPDWAMYFRGIRQRQDLTQKEMAEALGLTQSNISDIERGRRPIGKALAKKVAERFKAEYRLLL